MLIRPLIPLSQMTRVSNEAAIVFQEDHPASRELVMAIEYMRLNAKQTGKLVFDAAKLNEIFLRTMGLAIRFTLDPTLRENAYVIVPQIDKQHPLINKWRKHFASERDGVASVRWGGEGVAGEVDLAKVKVSGFYSKLVSQLFVTQGFIQNESFSHREIAAVIMHEIGHIMTYFIMLGQMDTTCYILTDFVRQAIKAETPEHKVKLFTELKKNTGIDAAKNEQIMNATNANTLQVLLLSEIAEDTRSEFGSSLFDARSFEALSDQFAARMGFSRDLATALDRLMRAAEPISYRNTFVYLMMEIGKTLFIIAGLMLPLAGVFSIWTPLAVLLMAASPVEREYDKPGERIGRLRKELVAQLKDPRQPKARTSALLEDIKVIDALEKEINDRESWHEAVWNMVFPYARRQRDTRQQLQQLENLVNNDLFVSAGQLRTA